MPDWNSWDKDTLPLCKHWRNAHEVPYPYVGANCVNSPRHEPPPPEPAFKSDPVTIDEK